MQKLNSEKQMKRLYAMTTVGYFNIAGASWVALLAMRGVSLLEIGVLESIFHVVSFCFEIPSGVAADVFGRKKTLVAGQMVSLLSALLMILSDGFCTTALAIGCSAISYNLASGTREALAYDSLKQDGREKDYNQFVSKEMMLYRITNSTATLCAGLSLVLGYRKAYLLDCLFGLGAILIGLGLYEIQPEMAEKQARERLVNVLTESWKFLKENKKARDIMMVNAMVGAVSTLVLFFLQAKLPLAGLENALLGPALFIMGLGAALGAGAVVYFSGSRYRKILLLSTIGVAFAFAMTFTGNPYVMTLGGLVGAFSDDFLEVRTDVLLNEMIPSGQRAALVSVNSFLFSMVMILMSTAMGWVMGM